MAGPLGPGTTRRLLLLTFLESIGTVLLQRGIYFYTSALHGFTESQNLWLAFAQGLTYVAGALLCHPLARRFGERTTALSSLILLCALHASLAWAASARLIAFVFPLIGLLHGVKWPLIESYVSGGRGPRELMRLLGRYNVSWALATPLAVAIGGALIDLGAHRQLFIAPALLNLVVLGFVLEWPAAPGRLAHDDPERPDAATTARYGSLASSARWTMVGSYALLFLLAPLMPTIFARLGLEVRHSTLAASLLDVLRLCTFVALGAYAGWHGKALPLWLTAAALPAGFFLILLGQDLALVLAGEALFGIASGIAYYAALYYALVVKNASVDAGGAHEGLIGLGLAVGPLAGLLGQSLAGGAGGAAASMMGAIAPIALVCLIGGFRPLWALRSRASSGEPVGPRPV